jgi:hypothetical protein
MMKKGIFVNLVMILISIPAMAYEVTDHWSLIIGPRSDSAFTERDKAVLKDVLSVLQQAIDEGVVIRSNTHWTSRYNIFSENAGGFNGVYCFKNVDQLEGVVDEIFSKIFLEKERSGLEEPLNIGLSAVSICDINITLTDLLKSE